MTKEKPEPSEEAAWRHFAVQAGGFVELQHFSDPMRVRVPVGNFEVILEHCPEDKALFTRMAAKFVSLDGFWFQLQPRRLLSDFGVWLGLPVMKSGDARIDEQFVVEASDGGKLRGLLAQPQIRFLIDAHPALNFGIDDSLPRRGAGPEIANLFVELPDLVTDLLVLSDMLELVRQGLAALQAAGSAGPPTT